MFALNVLFSKLHPHACARYLDIVDQYNKDRYISAYVTASNVCIAAYLAAKA